MILLGIVRYLRGIRPRSRNTNVGDSVFLDIIETSFAYKTWPQGQHHKKSGTGAKPKRRVGGLLDGGVDKGAWFDGG
jgi:hypothetical protein